MHAIFSLIKLASGLFYFFLQASRVTLTVGQAFQLAYERSQEAKEASEIFVKEMQKVCLVNCLPNIPYELNIN